VDCRCVGKSGGSARAQLVDAGACDSSLWEWKGRQLCGGGMCSAQRARICASLPPAEDCVGGAWSLRSPDGRCGRRYLRLAGRRGRRGLSGVPLLRPPPRHARHTAATHRGEGGRGPRDGGRAAPAGESRLWVAHSTAAAAATDDSTAAATDAATAADAGTTAAAGAAAGASRRPTGIRPWRRGANRESAAAAGGQPNVGFGGGGPTLSRRGRRGRNQDSAAAAGA